MSSPYINRFLQPDTIIPDLSNPQSWNRYSYVRNNPIRYNDPSGHREACDDGDTCKVQRKYSKLSAVDTWKKIIKDKFNIEMSDSGGKTWDPTNLALVNSRLNDLDDLFRGKLNDVIGSATFDLAEHHPDSDHPNSTYHGWTAGTHITFFTTGSNAIVKINFFHEFGHLINSLPGRDNIFSNQLDALDNPSFISDNYVNKAALLGHVVEPIQASNNTVTEQWGDVFANYAAGNIDLSKPTGPGMDMYNFITGALNTYLDEIFSDPVR